MFPSFQTRTRFNPGLISGLNVPRGHLESWLDCRLLGPIRGVGGGHGARERVFPRC